MARTLGCLGSPTLETADGTTREWARELQQRLIYLQRPDGFWQNPDGRWWEDDPVLTTAYALITLATCQDLNQERP